MGVLFAEARRMVDDHVRGLMSRRELVRMFEDVQRGDLIELALDLADGLAEDRDRQRRRAVAGKTGVTVTALAGVLGEG